MSDASDAALEAAIDRADEGTSLSRPVCVDDVLRAYFAQDQAYWADVARHMMQEVPNV